MENCVQGQALVASPYLTDPNFLRSVVYILRHDEDGAIGLLLNRPLGTTVGSLLEHLTDIPVHNDLPVYCGGPVDGPLMMLHRKFSATCGTSMFVASDQEQILQVCSGESESSCGQSQDEMYRVFDGYSGWSAGQLDAELKSGGWLLWDIPAEQVWGDAETLWQQAIRQIGRDILAGGIDPSKMPEDPAFN
jgi:putative transcriptional regulator